MVTETQNQQQTRIDLDGETVVDVQTFPVRLRSGQSPEELREAYPELQEIHNRYRDVNRPVSYTQSLYVSEGHPNSVDWIRLRAFFEQLVFASNSGARVYSYEGPTENVNVCSPRLGVRGLPTRASPAEKEGHEQYIREELTLVDENTWMQYPTWTITTQQEEFFEAFYQGQSEENYRVVVRQTDRSSEYNNIDWEVGDMFRFKVRSQSVDTNEQIQAIVDEFQSPIREATIPTYDETSFAARYLSK